MEIRNFNIAEISWLENKPLDKVEGIIADVQLSSEHITQKASISLQEFNQASISLNEPNYRVAPGQACVVYDNDRVLGGGWISGELSL